MFGEFHRGKDAMKYKPVGNGLGLFVCKNIIEAAGGHIGVTSEVGSGTTVRFALPLA
jgi:signal transduction histidine kinase